MITFRSTAQPAAVASGDLTFTEPSGAAQGDLLVVVIAYRDTAAFAAPSGWTLEKQESSGNTSTTTNTSIGSGLVAWIIRGGSAPALTFTRTGGDVAFGRIAAYKGVHQGNPARTSSSNTLAANSATVTTAALSVEAGDLIVIGACGADNTTASAYLGATDPLANHFKERGDNNTTTGADTTVALADAVARKQGSTGTLQYTAGNSSRHVCIAVAFRPGSNLHRVPMVFSESISAGTNSFATGSFTPPDNSLLVVLAGCDKDGSDANNNGNQTANVSITDSAGLSYTKRATGIGSAQTGGEAHIWTAPVGTAVSMTITLDHGVNTIAGYFIEVLAYINGQYRQAASFEPTGTGAQNATFASAPYTTSDCYSLACDGQGVSYTVGSGCILQRVDTLSGSTTYFSEQRDGVATTTMGWTVGSFSANGASLAVIEISGRPAPAPYSRPPIPFRSAI